MTGSARSAFVTLEALFLTEIEGFFLFLERLRVHVLHPGSPGLRKGSVFLTPGRFR